MTTTTSLRKKVAELKSTEPKLRQRDVAQRLGISEAELLSLNVGGNVTRLKGDWKNLLSSLSKMGYIMALTRNDNCVHERKGVYDNVTFYKGAHNMGVAVNPDIDLRFFMNEWKYGLAVVMDRGKHGKLYSFQFFDKRGEAVHKVFSTPKSDIEAYHLLVKLYKDDEQQPITGVDRTPIEAKVPKPDASIDVPAFQQEWRDLKDTHDFFGLVRRYELTRIQSFRLAPEGFTQKVDNQAVVRILEAAARQKLPIMCFVHSKGCIQIHTGEVKCLKQMGDWYNVLDPAFNLHLRMDRVAQTWVVEKPTTDGIVTSLELFDANGELIVYFFGARKPGKPELE
ncbi:MAG: ChuX/HutX family heme-like substrate-binding protein, partial [Bacteroidota bacterium]